MGDSRRVAVFAKRERKGSEKRQIGILNIQRMLPGAAHGMHGGNIPPGSFSGDTALMAMEDSYCDMWDRDDIIDHRTRSLFNVALMIGVGNVVQPVRARVPRSRRDLQRGDGRRARGDDRARPRIRRFTVCCPRHDGDRRCAHQARADQGASPRGRRRPQGAHREREAQDRQATSCGRWTPTQPASRAPRRAMPGGRLRTGARLHDPREHVLRPLGAHRGPDPAGTAAWSPSA